MMRKFFLFGFILCSPIFAGSVCVATPPPDTVNESIPVCTTIAGLGNQIFLPGGNFTAKIYWEDLDARDKMCPYNLPGDCDYNDADFLIKGNFANKTITVNFFGAMALYTNTMSLDGGSVGVSRDSVGPQTFIIPWVIGSELILKDYVFYKEHLNTWSTGDGSRNADGKPHAIVIMEEEVPESATVNFLVLGALVLLLASVLRKKK